MVSTRSWGEGTRFFLWGTLLILLVLAASPYSAAQQGQYSSESLFIAIFSNGDAVVDYDVGLEDPLAEETRIRLFAESSITNLIVVDEEDNVIDFDPGSVPNEIVLRTPAVSTARISYSTQDLVDKTQGKWIFSLNSSAIGFAVKLPPDSVLIDPGENFPTIKPIGDQQLLTFKPGNVRFVYVIGVLGTEEQANIVIRLAENTIEENTKNHPGIVLTDAQELLQRALQARDDAKFPEAETLAFQANDAAAAAGKDYEEAQSLIEAGDAKIRQANEEGRDTADARQLLEMARSEFGAGNYLQSKEFAEQIESAIGSLPEQPQLPLFVIIAASVAAGGGIGAMLFLRARRQRPPALMKPEARDPPSNPVPLGNDRVGENSTVDELPEPAHEMPYVPPQQERELDLVRSAPGALPESQTDKLLLSRIVDRIVVEKPHLRPEDQDVLRYLAEKEGAAFESEIRTKFQLPKTTIWRLVKRLEREELVEIRKAGGQNLIKLMFENRQP